MNIVVLIGIMLSKSFTGNIKVDRYVATFKSAEQCIVERDKVIAKVKEKGYFSYMFTCELTELRVEEPKLGDKK